MPSLTLSVTYRAEELDALRSAAIDSAPDRARWGEYPEPMRTYWRTVMGHGWAAQLAKPMAQLAPLDAPEAAPSEAIDGPPERDTRPPDLVPARPLAPAGAKARLRATGTLGGIAERPRGGGFLDSL